MTEAATALAALSDLDTWIVELAIPHHSQRRLSGFLPTTCNAFYRGASTYYVLQTRRKYGCKCRGDWPWQDAAAATLARSEMPGVLEVNTDFLIRTGQPVHFGKVRAVYWLTKADSARLIKDKGYDVAPDTDLAVMVIFETYPWVRFLTKMSTWQGNGSPVVWRIIT